MNDARRRYLERVLLGPDPRAGAASEASAAAEGSGDRGTGGGAVSTTAFDPSSFAPPDDSSGQPVERPVMASPEDFVLAAPVDEETRDRGLEGLDALRRGEELSGGSQVALEAIVHLEHRPALEIVDGVYPAPGPPWEDLDGEGYRRRLGAASRAVGAVWWSDPALGVRGTAFAVGPDRLLTNRHVAERFAPGVRDVEAELVLDLGAEPRTDLAYERGTELGAATAVSLGVESVVLVHPHWDCAVLRVPQLEEVLALREIEPLGLAATEPGPEAVAGGRIAVLGHPVSGGGPEETTTRVFGDRSGVKRLQPGLLDGRGSHRNPFWEVTVESLRHDASTLGGNSGSAVVDLETGLVVGLHFAGFYLETNHAVPSWELARDERVWEAGVGFAATAMERSAARRQAPPAWLDAWGGAEPA